MSCGEDCYLRTGHFGCWHSLDDEWVVEQERRDREMERWPTPPSATAMQELVEWSEQAA